MPIPSASTTLLRQMAADSRHVRWGEFVRRYQPMMEEYLRCNREMMLVCPDARDVVRALKGFGRYYATPEIVAQMSKRYTDRQWEEVCKASK